MPAREPDFVAVTRAELRRLGVRAPSAELAVQVWESLRIRSVQSRQLFDDALPTLAALRARGLLLGIVTNRAWGGDIFEDDLVRMGVRAYIAREATAVSADLGPRKPDPAIFEHALRALEVGPEAAAMVGDALVADVGGASALGMVSIWKPRVEVLWGTRASLGYQRDGAHGIAGADRERLLASAWQREMGQGAEHAAPMPDIIIEHLGELLPPCEQPIAGRSPRV
jgi:HAD superfamily hydrolase (TIGR01549 family)